MNLSQDIILPPFLRGAKGIRFAQKYTRLLMEASPQFPIDFLNVYSNFPQYTTILQFSRDVQLFLSLVEGHNSLM
jgi:hypothetical protein